MTEQEYTLRRDLLRDAIRKQRSELGQLEQDLNELEQEWNGMTYVTGKKYRVVQAEYEWSCDNIVEGFEFEVSNVNSDGDCWSENVTYSGRLLKDGEGWRVCGADALRDGYVVEVSQ